MSPTPCSPATKLSFPHRPSSQDSANEGIRKRVCKACDRCRLKKSKCDGSSPCSRCKVDNAICVFGERKKSHDKVYPKGYVEMLEQQQVQLVSGLREMYRRLQSAKAWDSKRLPESNGYPLTHDILAALNLLEHKHDGSGMVEPFEEDVQKIQSRLIAEGHGYVQQRRGSISSESEHSQHGNHRPPVLARPTPFRDSFNFGSNTSSPLVQSPVPQQRQPQISAQLSPVQASFAHNDPQLYAPEWAQALSNAATSQASKFGLVQEAQCALPIDGLDLMSNNGQWETGYNFDESFINSTYHPQYENLQPMGDAALDGVDIDFSKFVNPSTEVYI